VEGSVGSQLRVFSGNLKNGEADPDAFVNLLEACKADVVVVQELAPNQAEVLGRAFPHGRLEPSRDHTGMGIALRRPAEFDRVPLGYRDAHIARLDCEHWPALTRPLEIVNVHIASPTWGPGFIQFPRRRVQTRLLCDYLDRTRVRVRAVLGDFNATPIWPVYRNVSKRLEDLALSYARLRSAKPARTWARWVGGPRLFRIDHCFGHGVSVDDFSVVEISGSDHSGLIVDLSVDADAKS
jgi:endonuclease/exonuclease/phosphatase family metal-dependent hydrolase